ncbi:hypothetical protein L1987_60166 [Smallanthus sonchifolius]|uniref:Uncharacterized protein n=1 Tax=Smallanthus sonchifolius TaxID=185202 RepID=A0ACB9D856_9ASTR|nr:hypothetical protein L1987_60166 [Smallanthus sonchifolius]
MDLERKRVAPTSSKNGVVGSVWESRMKDSLKVFNGDKNNQEIEEKKCNRPNLQSSVHLPHLQPCSGSGWLTDGEVMYIRQRQLLCYLDENVTVVST